MTQAQHGPGEERFDIHKNWERNEKEKEWNEKYVYFKQNQKMKCTKCMYNALHSEEECRATEIIMRTLENVEVEFIPLVPIVSNEYAWMFERCEGWNI
jgi:hypothetical protein